MLTVSILLLSQFLGVAPGEKDSELQARKIISESLAVQISAAIMAHQMTSVGDILRSATERNESVQSAALRRKSGDLVSEAGDHNQHWDLEAGEHSTAEQIRVPIYNGGEPWGSFEVSFPPLGVMEDESLFQNSFYGLTLFVALVGFLLYLVFLKRALRELNPDAVIPDRVRKALDTLAEGLLILDQKEHILFANAAFAKKTGLTAKTLMGKKARDLDWEINGEAREKTLFPWTRINQGETVNTRVQLKLITEMKERYTFQVSASPINGQSNEVRGALVTFDDVTEIEHKNTELEQTLGRLKQSQKEISRQNQELQVLATRDPLTNCMNRRSFFEGFKTLFQEAREQGEELSCIMTDIDHFKSVNDRFGHATGDKVIKLVAGILINTVRPNDLVGRYGGEEFCVVLQGADMAFAHSVAERMRSALLNGNEIKFTSAIRITASFGVSSLADGAPDPSEMVNQADIALYAAKENGRNRVVGWSQKDHAANSTDDIVPQENHPPAQAMAAPKREISQTDGQQTTTSLRLVDTDPDDGMSSLSDLKQQVQQLEQALLESQNADASKLYRDDSTGLPNQLLLFDRISQAIERARRNNTKAVVMILDIDMLQRINDTFGVTVATKSVKAVSVKLKRILRSTDTVSVIDKEVPTFSISRINNDRFVILLSDLQQIESVVRVINRIFSSFKKAVTIEGNEIYLNANIGLSLFPDDGHTADHLLSHASSAMRQAKQSSGRSKYTFYSNDIDKQLKQQVRLENELFKATERGELILYYQPKVDLQSARITGMEALVRWKHPRLGLVPPNDFIPLAEQSGIIHKIGSWVIRTACLQSKMWWEKGYGEISIAVNLSPVQFQSEAFAANLLNQVADSGMPPSILELEITESVVMQNVDSAVATMDRFSRAGMQISLDDFGTGYSSLSCLKRFPVDKLKIDRTFISDITSNPSDASLVSSIIGFLQELGCNEIQGYFISRPVPREAADKLLGESASIRHKVMNALGDSAYIQAVDNLPGAPAIAGVLNETSLPPVAILQEHRANRAS
jgi:diguanylate cyclase (GGDEF)-like protein/PAS domain S-box-containing protein